MHVYIYIYAWLNYKDTFCLYNTIKILSSFLISVLVPGWNWWMNFPKFLKKDTLINTLKNTLYTCKQLLMMAYERFESARDNFRKFIQQFQPETNTLIRKLERIEIKLYRQNVSLLFSKTTHAHTNTHTHTHTHTYIYIYIYIYIYK